MLTQDVIYILSKLESAGYEAYVVGGAVRNHILDLPIKDWDITTNALPDQIESLFEQTYDVGKAFGTINVVLNDVNYEVTTYRQDSDYSDGRHPDQVTFSLNLKDDLSRRDFTMNAMVMNSKGQIYDFYNGQDALSKRKVFTVGDAKKRFKEDYLRVYRYVRFTQVLNFNRNNDIDEVIKNLCINKDISFERIQEEFNKIILSQNPSKGLNHLKDLGLLNYIVPGIEKTYDFNQHSKYHHLDVFNHTMSVVDHTQAHLETRLAALLHDIGKPNTFTLENGEGHFYGHHRESMLMAEVILKRLKYPNKTIEMVLHLIHYHMTQLNFTDKSLRKFIRKIQPEAYFLWSDLRKADILSCKNQESVDDMVSLDQMVTQILKEVPALTVNDLDINGYDLMSLGITGKAIGHIKQQLLDWIDDYPNKNQKEDLMEQALKFTK